MSPARTATGATSQARLGAIIKRVRDIMRKDAGLNGDLDRIPHIAWLLFLKALDDLDAERAIVEDDYSPLLAKPYRWGNWAGDRAGRTGDDLLMFVNDKLLPYLRELRGTGQGDRRDVVAQVFGDVQNRMMSGFLLREVVDQISQVSFVSADDIHTMSHLYETMLREMRDSAGDSGEFYTPRPIVRFMVKMINPRIGESVLDPAAGTGGFLVEAYEYLRAQASAATQLRSLDSLVHGVEKKPQPYLLCQMNLLLHRVNGAALRRDNTLARDFREHRRQRVDVVLTNPPFGGEEEKGVVDNFPRETRTSATEWLFLQVVMERLKPGGRCAIVVPNKVLFDDGATAQRIKKKLLDEFDLHTVVRLPNGVFSPYTLIPSNLLFFEKGGPTKDIWFYEHPMPEGRKNYTKTKPLRYEELELIEQWWSGDDRSGRKETVHAWKVPRSQVVGGGYNLDLRNPHRPDDLAHRPPGELIADLIETEEEILDVLRRLQKGIAGGVA